MNFKCAPQFIGLVRGENPKGKHRANGRKLCKEAGEERASRSNTLDKSLSHNNTYEGFSSGSECWDAMVAAAEEYRTTYTDKNGVVRHRKLKSDAVIGCALVLKIPCDVCSMMPRDQVRQFYDDAADVMCEIEPRIFSKKNIKMRSTHRDEGMFKNGLEEHDHFVYECKDLDGNYCGKLIDSLLYRKVNEEFPARMRERGWALEDLDVTDWKKFNEDDAYKEEREKAVQEKGLPVNYYASRRAYEKLKDSDGIANGMIMTAQKTAKQKLAATDKEIAQKRAEKEAEIARQTADFEAYKAEQTMFIAKQRQDVANMSAKNIREREKLEEDRRKAEIDIARMRGEAQDNIQGMYKRADDQIAERHQKYVESLTEDEKRQIYDEYKAMLDRRAEERSRDADEIMDEVTDNLNTNKVAKRIEEMKNASVSTPAS